MTEFFFPELFFADLPPNKNHLINLAFLLSIPFFIKMPTLTKIANEIFLIFFKFFSSSDIASLHILSISF